MKTTHTLFQNVLGHTFLKKSLLYYSHKFKPKLIKPPTPLILILGVNLQSSFFT